MHYFISPLDKIINSIDISAISNAIPTIYIALIGVVGILAVYRLQFFENSAKDNREILIRYLSVLKVKKPTEDHNLEWYSYMDNPELEQFTDEKVIPEHQKDFDINKAELNRFYEEAKAKAGSFGQGTPGDKNYKAAMQDLENVISVVNASQYSPHLFKELNFYFSRINGTNTASHSQSMTINNIRQSRMRVDTLQKRLKNLKNSIEKLNSFKRDSIIILVFFLVAFWISLLLPVFSGLINDAVVFLISIFLFLTVSVVLLLFYTLTCLQPETRKSYEGPHP